MSFKNIPAYLAKKYNWNTINFYFNFKKWEFSKFWTFKEFPYGKKSGLQFLAYSPYRANITPLCLKTSSAVIIIMLTCIYRLFSCWQNGWFCKPLMKSSINLWTYKKTLDFSIKKLSCSFFYIDFSIFPRKHRACRRMLFISLEGINITEICLPTKLSAWRTNSLSCTPMALINISHILA